MLTPDQARWIRAELGAGLVVLGSVLEVTGERRRMVLNAELTGVADSSIVGRSTTDPLSADSLEWSVFQLVAELFGQQLPERPPRSLAALRAYVEGQSYYRVGRYDSATVALARSLELDPDYALAGLRLSASASWLSPFLRSEAESGILAAVRGRESLTLGADRFLNAVVGPNYPEPSTLSEYLGAWQNAADAAASGPEALFELGDGYSHWGVMTGSSTSLTDAREAFDRSLELDTAYAAPKGHLIEIAVLQGDTTVSLDELPAGAKAVAYVVLVRTSLSKHRLPDEAPDPDLTRRLPKNPV